MTFYFFFRTNHFVLFLFLIGYYSFFRLYDVKANTNSTEEHKLFAETQVCDQKSFLFRL